MKFTEFCEQNGIKLLRDDFRYIVSMIGHLQSEARKACLKAYADEWLAELEFNQHSSQAMNMARRRANLALPEIVESVLGKIRGLAHHD